MHQSGPRFDWRAGSPRPNVAKVGGGCGNRQERKGTGLGLSFVREVAKLHGGSVRLRNHPEGGAEASLELPAG